MTANHVLSALTHQGSVLILDEPTRVAKEEIFGPVVCVIPFDTEQEDIDIANDTEFALVASVFSKDSERALRVGRAVEA